MAGAKILITGLANSGKTTLLKPLDNALVFAIDGKPFSLELPHVNIVDYGGMSNFSNLIYDKIEAYKSKIGKYPSTIVFDSVSRLFTDIETLCSKRFSGFDVWSNVNKEINTFLDVISDLQNNDFSIVLISHCVWDEKAGKYIETSKGSFAKTGAFLSTTDYAINIDVVGKKHIITHRGNSLSRTLIDDIPDKQDSSEFNLQTYLNKIKEKSNTVQEKWSI